MPGVPSAIISAGVLNRVWGAAIVAFLDLLLLLATVRLALDGAWGSALVAALFFAGLAWRLHQGVRQIRQLLRQRRAAEEALPSPHL